jgi:ribosomal protein S27AE
MARKPQGGEESAICRRWKGRAHLDQGRRSQGQGHPDRHRASSEATLLTAMEGAGKLIEDEELREAMSERGLGTPATRAATIEGLLAEEYTASQRPRAAADGQGLLRCCLHWNGLQVDEIRSPELTGEWEYKLKEMEHGRLSRDEFMQHIMDRTRAMVERIKTGEFADPDFGTLKTPCPRCGAKIHEGYKHFTCEKCDYKLWKVVASRQWGETAEMDELLAKRTIRPAAGLPQQDGARLRRHHQAQGRPHPRVRFRSVRRGRRWRRGRFQRPGALGAPVPNAPAASSITACPMSAKRAWARDAAATSAPAR